MRVQGQWLVLGGLGDQPPIAVGRASARRADPARSAVGAAPQPRRVFEGRLEDEQGKFNLRNLVNRQRVDDGAAAGFRAPVRLIGVNPG